MTIAQLLAWLALLAPLLTWATVGLLDRRRRQRAREAEERILAELDRQAISADPKRLRDWAPPPLKRG